MPLPKINHPLYDLTIPSTQQPVKVRPMLAKEEKLLLMAKESEEDNDILSSIKQVVNNCLVTKMDVDKLALFDLEFVFLKLRQYSVSNEVEVTYRDNDDYNVIYTQLTRNGVEDGKAKTEAEKNSMYTFKVDLNSVNVKFSDVDKMIKVDEKITLRMRYPAASLYTDKEFLNAESGKDTLTILIRNCLDAVVTDGTALPISGTSKQEIDTFLDDLPIPAMDKVRIFLSNIPSIYHEIKYTNKQGTERKIVLNTLNDFFTLR